MKAIARFLGNRCLDFIDWIYRNRPEGERLTVDDLANIQESRKLREKFK